MWLVVVRLQEGDADEEAEGRRKDNKMREIVHIQAGQCGNQIGSKVSSRPMFICLR